MVSYPEPWDGSTKQRPATVYRSPSAGDWERLLEELAADRRNLPQLINFNTGFPDGTPVTAAGQADSLFNPRVIGLALGYKIQVSGVIELTGLQPQSVYYLGLQSLTATPPTAGWLVEIGVALDETRLLLSIRQPIRL